MECGIIGLPLTGKTTLFNALTGSRSETAAGALKPNIGIAAIPDPRLGVIAQYITTRKIVPATIRLVDLPGLPVESGADTATRLNQFLAHVRQVDAICAVIRCFDPDVNPQRDMEILETELVLADLQVAESALDKAARPARAGDREAAARVDLLGRLKSVLEDGRAIRAIATDLSDAQRHMMKSYGMITAKPVLYVANVDEDELAEESSTAAAVREHAEETGGTYVRLCAKLEAELAELDPGDRQEMIESLGLTEPAIGPLARALLSLLGMAVFYTAGDKEVRAWTIPIGATAPEAAGAIHSDMQRGFIRAECYHIDDLVQYKSEKAIREAGRLRSEGKSYRMQDGDIAHFLFNV